MERFARLLASIAFILPSLAWGQATCVGDQCPAGAGPYNTITSVSVSGPITASNLGVVPLSPVKAATTGSLPFNPTYNNGQSGNGATLIATANGALTVDGYTVAFSDRVLIKNQALAYQNGIYVVTATGGASAKYQLSRATDLNTTSQFFSGITTYATNGTTNGQASFVIVSTGPISVGVTAINFQQFTSSTAVSGFLPNVLPSGNIFVGTGGGLAVGVPLTGDCSIIFSGAVTCLKTNGTSFGSLATSTDAANLTGTIANGRLSGSYTGITGTGALSAGSLAAGFGAASVTTLNASGDALFKSGIPWADVRAWGAKGDGTTDDTAAVQAAINAAIANGGRVFFPQGNYCLFTGVSINSAVAVRLTGANDQTYFSSCHHDTTLLTITNGNSIVVEHFGFLGYGITAPDTAATQPVISFQCTECLLDDLQITGGSNAIFSNGGGDGIIRKVTASYAYGSAVIYVKNGGHWFDRVKFDQGHPTGALPPLGTTVPNWAATTSYSTNQLVINGSVLLQATVGGTSGGSTPTNKPYFQNMTDGSVTWQRAGQAVYYGVQLDTGAYQNFFRYMDIGGPYRSNLALTNTLSGAAPGLTMVSQSNMAGGWVSVIGALAGSGLQLVQNTLSFCNTAGCPIIDLDSAWVGTAIISDNILWDGGFGVLINAGVNTTISGNQIFGTSAAAVQAAGGIGNFVVSGNQLGTDPTFGGANLVAVNVVAGASDYYNIVNNIVHGAGSGVADGGSGTHKTISGNN